MEVQGDYCKKRKEMEDELTEKLKVREEVWNVWRRSGMTKKQIILMDKEEQRIVRRQDEEEREATGGFRKGDGRKKISKKARGGERERKDGRSLIRRWKEKEWREGNRRMNRERKDGRNLRRKLNRKGWTEGRKRRD